MRQANINVEFGKTSGTTFIYNMVDLTGDAQPVAQSFTLDLKIMSAFDIEDSEEGIEKFCAAVTFDLGAQMLKNKIEKLRRFQSKTGSGIILPGQ